jgi:hypothetical protein
MFQFPRFPLCFCRVTAHHGRRVAPFGDLWITGCQPLPRAFRRVAASFIGSKAPRHPPSALLCTCSSSQGVATPVFASVPHAGHLISSPHRDPTAPGPASSLLNHPRTRMSFDAGTLFVRSRDNSSAELPSTRCSLQVASSHDGAPWLSASFQLLNRSGLPARLGSADLARSARSVRLSRCRHLR